ncbi:D-alanyl-D-alanine carboxypeptidase family protein [uncultured Allofournierella sp.]|uniref:D-alanyl-D-alanine carboxypeptidase family protein n=1 Tax=uncultured Allofournierella sp. TaxID=1940258 RepID=UPI00375070F4
MKHKWKAGAAAALLMVTMLLPLPVAAQGLEQGRFELPQFDVPCKTAILIDQDSGTVLYEKQADAQVPIASITKVMTMLLAMEALEQGRVQLTDIVPVSEHAYSMGGSQIWLEPGEQLTLDEMMRAICVSSANDAAVAVAEFLAGSEQAFVEAMNQKAQELGMTSTTFRNACGLDEPGHLSTARDVARMSREILTKHPKIMEYTGIWMDSLRQGQTQLINTNKLLKRYEGITGLKTGTTGGAGVCLTASATRNGLSLIAVVLGSPSSGERFTAATTLLDYGFANYENHPLSLPSEAPQTIAVEQGSQETVALTYQMPGGVLLRQGETADLEVKVELEPSVQAPVEQGQQLGTVTVWCGQQQLGQWPVTAAQEVPRLDLRLALNRLLAGLLQ